MVLSSMNTDFPTPLQDAAPKKGEASGIKRKWLRTYELLPGQLLNVYGRARFSSMADETFWSYSYLAAESVSSVVVLCTTCMLVL